MDLFFVRVNGWIIITLIHGVIISMNKQGPDRLTQKSPVNLRARSLFVLFLDIKISPQNSAFLSQGSKRN